MRAGTAGEGRGHVGVDLHGSGPQSHRLLAATQPRRLVAFGCARFTGDGRPFAGPVEGPAWDPGEHEVDRWCRLLRTAGGECGREDLRLDVGDVEVRPGEVLLHPGAASGARRWPADRWAQVAAALLADGRQVTLTGTGKERELCEHIAAAAPGARVAAGELDVPALARRVAGATLLVCGDTGVAHVATAVGTASVLLFGPTPPDRWGPAVDQDLHRVLWHGEEGYVGDPHAPTLDPALARITPDEVLACVRRLSGETARTTRRSGPGPRPSRPWAPTRAARAPG